MVETVFGKNLAEGAKVSATNFRNKASWFAPENAIDNDRNTYWATDEGIKLATLTLEFEEPVTFNRFMVEEYVRLGQRVKDFTLVALVEGEWVELKDSPLISNMGVYLAPQI